MEREEQRESERPETVPTNQLDLKPSKPKSNDSTHKRVRVFRPDSPYAAATDDTAIAAAAAAAGDSGSGSASVGAGAPRVNIIDHGRQIPVVAASHTHENAKVITEFKDAATADQRTPLDVATRSERETVDSVGQTEAQSTPGSYTAALEASSPSSTIPHVPTNRSIFPLTFGVGGIILLGICIIIFTSGTHTLIPPAVAPPVLPRAMAQPKTCHYVSIRKYAYPHDGTRNTSHFF